MSLSWLCDRDDPRVVTALGRVCDVCGARIGTQCSLPGATALISGAIVHMARVPDKVLLAPALDDLDHLPAEKVRG